MPGAALAPTRAVCHAKCSAKHGDRSHTTSSSPALTPHLTPRSDAHSLDDILRYASYATRAMLRSHFYILHSSFCSFTFYPAQTLTVWMTYYATLRMPPEPCPARLLPLGRCPQGGGGLPPTRSHSETKVRLVNSFQEPTGPVPPPLIPPPRGG